MKESIPALKRKIARLEFVNGQIQSAFIKSQEAYRDALHEFIDYKMRNEQAMKLLNGEDV
jgi:hypothetical protein